MGIIGGKNRTGTGPAYAARVAPDETLTALSGGSFPSTTGLIGSVAINIAKLTCFSYTFLHDIFTRFSKKSTINPN